MRKAWMDKPIKIELTKEKEEEVIALWNEVCEIIDYEEAHEMNYMKMFWKIRCLDGGWNELDEYHIATLDGTIIGQANSEEEASLIIKAHNDLINELLGGVQ